MASNNVTRMLQAKKITFTVYDTPVEKLGALETARILGVPAEIVYKTIVVQREKPGKVMLALLPGTAEVDLKALAAAVGEKKLHLPTEREAEQLTGLQAGGISPLALIHRGFQVVIDSAALELPEIHISGGQRGMNIRLPVADLARLTGAKYAAISHSPGAAE